MNTHDAPRNPSKERAQLRAENIRQAIKTLEDYVGCAAKLRTAGDAVLIDGFNRPEWVALADLQRTKLFRLIGISPEETV